MWYNEKRSSCFQKKRRGFMKKKWNKIATALVIIFFFGGLVVVNRAKTEVKTEQQVVADEYEFDSEMSDEDAFACIASYCQGDVVNVDSFLASSKYEPVGPSDGRVHDDDVYLYQCGDEFIISIEKYGDCFMVGDGDGTWREFGLDTGEEVYESLLVQADPASDELVTHHVLMPAGAIAEVVRWVYR